MKLGDKSVIPEMEKCLESEDRAARCNAGFVLAGLGDDRGLKAVLAELQDKGNRPARGMIRSDGGSDIEGRIRQDRYYAAHVLGQLGDKRAVPVLLEYLYDEDIFYKVYTTLGEIGDPLAVYPLKVILKHEDAQHRFWAACGLAMLGDEEGVTAIIAYLKDDDRSFRKHAAKCLAEFGGERAFPALIEALEDRDVHVRRSVVNALGNLGDRRALPHLEKLLDDKTPITRGDPLTISGVAQREIKKLKSELSNPRIMEKR